MGEDDAQDEACQAEGYPGEAVACKGQGGHEGVQAAQGKACGVETVIEGGEEGEESGGAVYAAVAAVEGVGEREEHQGNGEGIEEHEHRNGCLNNGGEAEEGYKERNDREGRHPQGVGKGRNETGEIFSAGGNESHTGGEAGQEYDDTHDDAAIGAEVVMGGTHQHAGTVFLHAQFCHRAGAQEAEEDVNNAQAGTGDEAAFQGRKGHFFIGVGAVLTDGIDYDNAEYEGSQGIHGAVAVQEALGEGFHGIPIAVGSRLPGAHGMDGGNNEKKGQEKEEYRRNDFADTADQLIGADGKPPGNDEEKEAENIESAGFHGASEEGGNSDFKGCGGRTGDGKGWPDGKVQGHREENGILGVDAGSQGLQVIAGITDGRYPQDRKAHTGDQKADGGGNGIDAGTLTHEYGEYQVAGAEEEGEEHEPDGNEGIG